MPEIVWKGAFSSTPKLLKNINITQPPLTGLEDRGNLYPPGCQRVRRHVAPCQNPSELTQRFRVQGSPWLRAWRMLELWGPARGRLHEQLHELPQNRHAYLGIENDI